jgi:hypothetical protein
LQEIDDRRWRQAARALKLDLIGADGNVVAGEGATQGVTQGDAMRGRIDGYRVDVRHGASMGRDRTTFVDVVLPRGLLLGLEAPVYRDHSLAQHCYGIVPRAVFSVTPPRSA